MSELIIVKPEKCVGCNACVRACPAPEANITRMIEGGKFITSINPDRCIGCGACVVSCNHGARDYIDDTDECMNRMKRDKMIVLVSSSIKSVFPTKWKGILDWFRKQGCIIYDEAFGADICTWAHLRAIEQKKVGNIITQPCSAIVKYVETYQPKLLANLSPIHSPVSCSAIYIRKYLNRNNPIALLSPCVAKKYEFEETGLVDFNVTFRKLNEYFEKNGISIPVSSAEDYEYKFDDQQGQVGAIYPRPGGLRDNLWLHNPDINVTTSEGVNKVYPELDMYAEMPDFKHPEVFDVLSCEFGCNVGPGTDTSQTMFDVMLTMKEVEKEAKGRRKGGFMGRGEDRMFKKFDDELKLSDFLRNYKPVTPTPVPTERQLDPIYESMGQHTEDEKHYDCRACGYRSCREMAIAIYRGLNTPDNCVIHAKSVMVARHSELAEQHEKLAEITYECLELSDKLKEGVDSILKNMDTIGESTTKTSERAAVVKDLLTNVVAFCHDNSTMDAGSVSQLITMLETTIEAFSALDDNVNVTNESSSLIDSSIGEINKLVEEINDTLHKASEKK